VEVKQRRSVERFDHSRLRSHFAQRRDISYRCADRPEPFIHFFKEQERLYEQERRKWWQYKQVSGRSLKTETIWNRRPRPFTVIIETPKGSRNKYALDQKESLQADEGPPGGHGISL
jgi:hypothetical protein